MRPPQPSWSPPLASLCLTEWGAVSTPGPLTQSSGAHFYQILLKFTFGIQLMPGLGPPPQPHPGQACCRPALWGVLEQKPWKSGHWAQPGQGQGPESRLPTRRVLGALFLAGRPACIGVLVSPGSRRPGQDQEGGGVTLTRCCTTPGGPATSEMTKDTRRLGWWTAQGWTCVF